MSAFGAKRTWGYLSLLRLVPEAWREMLRLRKNIDFNHFSVLLTIC
jgi:hypothetical protein